MFVTSWNIRCATNAVARDERQHNRSFYARSEQRSSSRRCVVSGGLIRRGIASFATAHERILAFSSAGWPAGHANTGMPMPAGPVAAVGPKARADRAARHGTPGAKHGPWHRSASTAIAVRPHPIAKLSSAEPSSFSWSCCDRQPSRSQLFCPQSRSRLPYSQRNPADVTCFTLGLARRP